MRKTSSFGPNTPGRTEDSARESWGGLSARAHAATQPSVHSSVHRGAVAGTAARENQAHHDQSILRADSAQEVPVKRRATGRFPSWSRGKQVTVAEQLSEAGKLFLILRRQLMGRIWWVIVSVAECRPPNQSRATMSQMMQSPRAQPLVARSGHLLQSQVNTTQTCRWQI